MKAAQTRAMEQNIRKKGDGKLCCLNDCLRTIPQDDIEKFRLDYDSCKKLISQSAFIASYVDEIPTPMLNKRKFGRYYRIGTNQACFGSFTEILGISYTKVVTALEKCRLGDSGDQQGCPHIRCSIVSRTESTSEDDSRDSHHTDRRLRTEVRFE